MPRNKYPEETREKVLDAALRTFQEKGFDATTILDIVANMEGLTRGAFYHHFKSKEEVLTAICQRLFEHNNPFEQIRTVKNMTGLEKLRKALKANMVMQNNEFSLFQDASIELLKSPHFFMWQAEFNASVSHKFIQPLIEEGIADGSIKEQDPRIIAELFSVMFSFWLGSVLFIGDADYMEKKATAVFTILAQFGLELYDKEMDALGDVWLSSNTHEK